jgi:hypothetical protein
LDPDGAGRDEGADPPPEREGADEPGDIERGAE